MLNHISAAMRTFDGMDICAVHFPLELTGENPLTGDSYHRLVLESDHDVKPTLHSSICTICGAYHIQITPN